MDVKLQLILVVLAVDWFVKIAPPLRPAVLEVKLILLPTGAEAPGTAKFPFGCVVVVGGVTDGLLIKVPPSLKIAPPLPCVVFVVFELNDVAPPMLSAPV